MKKTDFDKILDKRRQELQAYYDKLDTFKWTKTKPDPRILPRSWYGIILETLEDKRKADMYNQFIAWKYLGETKPARP